MVLTKVKAKYNNSEWFDDLFNVSWEQPSLSFASIPTFEIETSNVHGRLYDKYQIGKDVDIYRNGEKSFKGVIEPTTYSKGLRGSTVKIKGKHKGYNNMRNNTCEIYRSANTDMVINPWEWGRKDINGNEVDGINPSDIFRNLIGTLFTYQEFFDNRGALIDTDASGARGFISVSLVDNDLSGVTKLMARPSGNYYVWDSGGTPGQAHSVSLHNGPIVTKSGQVVRGMGEIKSLTVKIYGDKKHITDPIIKVCRDANNVISERTYKNVVLNSPGTGDNVVWSGQVTLDDTATTKNQLGYVIYPNGAAATGVRSTTNMIDYIRIDAVTESDIGLTEGTIDVYVNPSGFEYKGNDSNNVAVNFAGINRLDAAERLRKMTISDDETRDNPHWDGWIDNDLKAHWVKRRGTNISKEYSFRNFNVTDITHQFNADNIINNVIAKGAGAPPYQLTIVSDDLIDLDSINKYGNRQGTYQDTTIKDAHTLFMRAKSYFKLHKDPIETVKIKIVNDWEKPWKVGDSIPIRDTDVGLNGHWRVINAKHSVRGEGNESIDLELGTKSYNTQEILKGLSDKLNNQSLFYQGLAASNVTSSIGIDFDKDKPAVYDFIIPEGVDVDRVYLYAKTDVFTGNTRSADGGGSFDITVSEGSTGTSTNQSYPSLTWTDTNATNKSIAVGSTATWSSTIPTDAKGGAVVHVNYSMPGGNQKHLVYVDVANTNIGRFIRETTDEGQNISFFVPDGAGDTVTLGVKNKGTADTSVTAQIRVHGIKEHGHNFNIPGHSHNMRNGNHTHPLVFGIYHFSGDNGGNGQAHYPTKIQMFVDKLPSDATAVAYEPWGEVGETGQSVTISKLDITEALKDANGNIKTGPHFVSFKPTGPESNNAQNLGRISVNHFISFNTKEAQS